MKNLTLVFKLLMMAMLISGVTACSKKGGKGASMRDRRGQVVDQNGRPKYVPGGPASNVNSNCPDCGYIFGNNNNNFQNSIMDFLGIQDPSEFGNISSAQGQNTGVFFRGNVNGSNGSSLRGQIEVVVWDDIANQNGGLPYVIQMGLDSRMSSSDLRNFARLEFRDEIGTLTLDGQFTQQGTFTGTVTYDNGNGGSRNLGSFITGDCNFITAGCP